MSATQIVAGAYSGMHLLPPIKSGDGGSLILPKDVAQMIPTGSFASSVILSTAQSISNVLLSPTQIDFILMGSTLSLPLAYYTQMYVQIAISNNDAVNDAVLCPGFLTQIYDSLQLLINGSQVISYQGGTSEMSHGVRYKILSNMTFQEYDNNGYAYGNLDGASGTITIAPSSTEIFLFPIHRLFPELCSIPLAAVGSELKLRINYGSKTNILVSTSPSTDISCQQLQMICVGPIIDGTAAVALRSQVASSTLKVPAITLFSRNFSIGTLAPNTRSTRQVINLRGWCLEMMTGANTDSITTPESLRANLAPVVTSNFYNSGGVSVWQGLDNATIEQAVRSFSYYGLSSVDGAALDRTGYFDSDLNYKSFCVLPVPDVTSGRRRHGSFSLSSSEMVDVVCSTALNATGQLWTVLFIASSLTLTGGILSYQVSSS